MTHSNTMYLGSILSKQSDLFQQVLSQQGLKQMLIQREATVAAELAE